MNNKWLWVPLMAVGCCGCEKYLDARPDKELVVPRTVKDLQSLLDDTRTFNTIYPVCGETASDDYYLTTPVWQSLGLTDRNSHIWEKDVFNDNDRNEWYLSYVTVYTANVVLETVEKPGISGSAQEKAAVRGAALFFRGYAFFHLLQVFAAPYTAGSADRDPGIPLRLSSDLNQPSVRSTVEESYGQVLRDLKEAIRLLPPEPLFKTRPSRHAAYAFLSRVYLNRGDYNAAAAYADSALGIDATLLDFNRLNSTAAFPVPQFNEEVLFHTTLFRNSALAQSRAVIDSGLWNRYGPGDLRRSVFFKKNSNGSYAFKGSYNGDENLFNGLSNDELYLNRAEALDRQGRVAEAMRDLNTLLEKRWKTGTFFPLVATGQEDALEIILEERRKELLMRGLRWSDLRRLNKEAPFAKTLARQVNGQTYTLPPGDPRWVFPIPEKVIRMTGMQQNPR